MADQKAWDTLAEQEAQALAELLATDGKCVMVIVVGADSDEQGTTHMLHGAAGQTRGSHLRQFISAVELKLKYLRDKLYRRA